MSGSAPVDDPVGWSPDGKQILFRSDRTNYSRITQLFTIPVEGGFETPVDLPMAYDGSYNSDASKLAYMPIAPAFQSWKRYRGGETTSIWLANIADAKVEKTPARIRTISIPFGSATKSTSCPIARALSRSSFTTLPPKR